ncbi:hypothetical protein CN964_21385 [Bacillus cereus]|uniref:hypothetical protein n=1 Tax=Bacillus cereus TaxID=1396 RepID=UPI000BF544A7|nr:hypothetical protein [Bacillus cereus]PFI14624.1 hypothetical protein COI71_23375 [Bacillus cereus]PFJ30962.1 hypothetical protein COI90_20840 [Bacillus cereus]PFO23950.1 hypothetical protein COJ80_16745 [Bacillus cereus]PGN71193.1 hypothetical protein CN964_21385 [Bacillus cereus]
MYNYVDMYNPYSRQLAPDGWLVTDGKKVYLMDKGKKRWVVNLQAFNALFRVQATDAMFFPGLQNVPDGPNIEPGTGLFRTEATDQRVFWLDKEDGVNVVKRWVTSPAAMDRYSFSWNIPTLPGYFATLPDGTPIVA